METGNNGSSMRAPWQFRYGQREGIHIEIDDPLILEELSCAQLHKGIGTLEFSFGHRILCAGSGSERRETNPTLFTGGSNMTEMAAKW